MERLLIFLVIAWVVVMAVGLVIALLPVFAFAAGFLGMMLLLMMLGRIFDSWFFF